MVHQCESKFIPVSNEALNERHFKAGKDMLSLYFNNNPTPSFSRKALHLVEVSPFMKKTIPTLGLICNYYRKFTPLGRNCEHTQPQGLNDGGMGNQMKAIINACISEDVTSLAGVPSWMLVILKNSRTNRKA